MHVNMTNLPGDKFGANVESTTIGGKSMFRLWLALANNTVQIWLTPEQLQQIGFAVSCAEQEADLAAAAQQAAYDEEGEEMLDAWIDASRARGVSV